MPRLILASMSPQRKRLLRELGIPFEVISSTFAESDHPEQGPRKRSMELAALKAREVHTRHPDAWVIGCDTLVVAADGELLEKPTDATDARRMLDLQSGRTSTVHSGLSVIDPSGREFLDVSTSKVLFRELSKEERDWWIESCKWEGRSGGFQIEPPGDRLFAEIQGDVPGIIGLPLDLLKKLLHDASFPAVL